MTEPTRGQIAEMGPGGLLELDLPRYVKFSVEDPEASTRLRTVHMHLATVQHGEDTNTYQLIATTGGTHVVPVGTTFEVVIETAAEANKRLTDSADTSGVFQLRVIQGGLL